MDELIKLSEKKLNRTRVLTGLNFYDSLFHLELGNIMLINGLDSRATTRIADSIACFLNKTNYYNVILFDKEMIEPERIDFIKNFGEDPVRDFNYVKNNFFVLEEKNESILANIDNKTVSNLIKEKNFKVIVLTNIESFETNGYIRYIFQNLKIFAEKNDVLIICTTSPKIVRYDENNKYLTPKFYDVNESMDALRYIDVVANVNETDKSLFIDGSSDINCWLDVEKTKERGVKFIKK